jgi:lipopolysaccharide export system protein LptC
MTYKNVFLSVLMMAAITLAAWTTLTYRPILSATQAAPLPDAYMEDVTTFIMDKLGKVNMKIVTPKMIHYTNNDTTDLTTPSLTLYRNSPNPWLITAKFAQATQGINYVNFSQDVMIKRAADDENPETSIKTTTLRVEPNNKVAETNDAITLEQPNIIVNATGMHADLNTGDIKLLSQARGEYVPSS